MLLLRADNGRIQPLYLLQEMCRLPQYLKNQLPVDISTDCELCRYPTRARKNPDSGGGVID